MQQDGWLDQAIYAVLNFLNEPWLGIVVPFVTAGVVAYLARRSPKQDWEYIREGPDKVLTAAFVLLAGVRSTPRLVVPTSHFVCDEGVDDLGFPTVSRCRFETAGSVHTVIDYTFGDFVREMLTSVVTSVVVGAFGGAAGWLIARVLIRRSPLTKGPRPVG